MSPIDGMPLGIQDIIETADMPTEPGSPLFVACHTGRVAALREVGAVILGKAVEFATTQLGRVAHSGRLEQRFRRLRRVRHVPGRARHVSSRLDPTAAR